jgi:serine beta-lactamase-like protein LACTB
VNDNVLEYVPGEEFLYTSVGYILLSALIESVSETPYIEFMSRQVFGPLGMASTEFDNSKAGLVNEATYYETREANGEFVLATLTRDRSFLFGGGGFISTPKDLVKLGGALYDSTLLSQDTVELLTTPVKLLNGQDNAQNYALGWRVDAATDIHSPETKMTIIHHGGVTGGASTAFLLVIPKYKVSIAYATNTDTEGFWRVRGEVLSVLKPFLKK